MSDTLELRLAGVTDGQPLAPRDLDFSEVDPIIQRLHTATLIESGLDNQPAARSVNRGNSSIRRLRDVHLSLVSVDTIQEAITLVVYKFAVGNSVSDAVSRITAGLAGIAGNHIVPNAAKEVRAGLKRAIDRGLSVQLVNGVETPMFSKENPLPVLDEHPIRKFESEIAAHVIRVGGKRPVAYVQLLGSRQCVSLKLGSRKIARELGNHLYNDAVLKGTGEWVVDPDRFFAPTRLIKFKVESYRLLQPVDHDSVIDRMTKASSGMWDDVDPTVAYWREDD